MASLSLSHYFSSVSVFQSCYCNYFFLRICRACPAEFVIPLTKFRKAVYATQLSVGMRFGMMFETEESGKRR